MSKKKKESKKDKAKVHKELGSLELGINSFGEINTNIDIEEINKFLNRNVEDKKLKDRDDLNEIKKKK